VNPPPQGDPFDWPTTNIAGEGNTLRRDVGVIDGYGLNQCYGILAYPGRNANSI
jgi:hypothetical protein